MRRDRKENTALMLSATTGQRITTGQLLGEEAFDAKAKAKQAKRDHKLMERKLRKKGIGEGQMIPVSATAQPFMGG